MYLMLTDETNNTPRQNAKFFVYGGLIIPLDALPSLHEKIATIRHDAGYAPADKLKFDTHARPAHIDHRVCTIAKDRVIDCCLELGCKFIAYVIHHDIIRNREARKYVSYAANTVIGRFNFFLREADSTGVCALDRLPVEGQFDYLAETFTSGLSVDNNARRVELDRILLFSITCINASHASSAMDIVLGSFRYVINHRDRQDVANAIMPKIARMMWNRERGGDQYLGERGLIVRPATVNAPAIKADYDDFHAYIQSLIEHL